MQQMFFMIPNLCYHAKLNENHEKSKNYFCLMNVCLEISTKRKKKGIEKGNFRQNWWILERSKGLCLIIVNEKLDKNI